MKIAARAAVRYLKPEVHKMVARKGPRIAMGIMVFHVFGVMYPRKSSRFQVAGWLSIARMSIAIEAQKKRNPEISTVFHLVSHGCSDKDPRDDE